MIGTITRIGFLRLLHGRLELFLIFVVPILFFSIFALIFDRQIGDRKDTQIDVAIVDGTNTAYPSALQERLQQHTGLRVYEPPAGERTTRENARQWIRQGRIQAAVILDPPSDPANSSESSEIELLVDSYDPVATQMLQGLVLQAALQAQAEALAASPLRRLPPAPGAPAVDDSTDDGPQRGRFLDAPNSKAEPSDSPSALDESPAPGRLGLEIAPPRLLVVDVLGEKKANPVVSMYAAGIAVMFLLFSATGGGGSLLEERESQTLERLLATRLTMGQLLAGKWLYLMLVGFLQVSVMFLWAQLVFRVDLWGHLPGFLTMTFVTASAAASFALLLATVCHSRTQLNAISVILVLTMSALGGSMVPRYVMSSSMQRLGLFTFNGWALDGYLKVFWRDLPVGALVPQVLVLGGCAIGFLLIARLLARRWETE